MEPGAIRQWLAAEPVFREVATLVCRRGDDVYLVGGTVRDLLVGRASYDMDLAVVGEAMPLARHVADAIGGAYVAMDPERDVARVVVRRGGVSRLIDLAGLRASTIEDDLRARDFTVNAMAVSLCAPERGILDPTGGRADLAARLLRATHPGAFADDPLRLLRGVRLRTSLGWTIAPETERLMRAWAPELRRASPERVRDELALILSLDAAADGLALARALGILAPALPRVEDAALAEGIDMVGALERLEPAWGAGAAAPLPGLESSDLRRRLGAYLQEELSGGRTRRLALRLAALLYPSREGSGVVAEALRLSVREVRLVAGAVAAAHRLREGDMGRLPGRLAIYRYFREAREAGVAGALLALAAAHAVGGEAPAAHVAALVRAWFEERRAVVDPQPLLSGRDVMAELGIEAGPGVGRALEALREAQVQGLVRTPEEALDYLRRGCRADGRAL